MKANDVSRDWRIILGLALILLGVGNWIVGQHKVHEYSSLINSQPDSATDDSYRSFDELDSSATAVLEPFTAEQRRVSYAMARMDFYHAAFLTGYAMVIGGLIVTFFGFITLIRRDASRVTGKLNVQALGEGPPTV
jgi:hypothetical protein